MSPAFELSMLKAQMESQQVVSDAALLSVPECETPAKSPKGSGRSTPKSISGRATPQTRKLWAKVRGRFYHE